MGVYVDDNGDPIPQVEELPKAQDTARSHSTKKVKEVKKAGENAIAQDMAECLRSLISCMILVYGVC